MRIVVASDHGGFEYKNEIKAHLEKQGHDSYIAYGRHEARGITKSKTRCLSGFL